MPPLTDTITHIQTSEEAGILTLQIPLAHPIARQLKRLLLCAQALAQMETLGLKENHGVMTYFCRLIERLDSLMLSEVANVLFITTPITDAAQTTQAMSIALQTLTCYEALYMEAKQ